MIPAAVWWGLCQCAALLKGLAVFWKIIAAVTWGVRAAAVVVAAVAGRKTQGVGS